MTASVIDYYLTFVRQVFDLIQRCPNLNLNGLKNRTKSVRTFDIGLLLI